MGIIIMILIIVIILTFLSLASCNNSEPTEPKSFEEVINHPLINSREVGEREGIKYFQIMKNGKTGFRDLDGNVVIEPKFDMAEMFSEGLSAVQMGDKWGYIDESGSYILEPQFEYAGSFHQGLASVRINDLYGFINRKGELVVKPQYAWVDKFSENLCVVRNEEGMHGYIDTTGNTTIPFKYNYANSFKNGEAKVQVNKLWGAIDKSGKFIEQPTHPYATWE
ncbi:MAG: WG repeat-containing protein [Chitinophagales bacterium]|nr:WG repeat-containing protein [Chitinophagales bacterium]